MQIQANHETGIFGGGCFWCIEAIFGDVKGVINVESGYAGGNIETPTYAEVCTGETGHAEVVKVIFDPNTISYKKLLEIFFTIHDPTTLNRQGADIGTQYRSIILYTTEDQKEIANEFIQQENEYRKANERECKLNSV
jgi:peptide-methionine (S)-S-oxide reductase